MENNTNEWKSIIRHSLIILLFSIPSITGCTYPAQSINMIPNDFEVKNNHPNSVTIQVNGGEESRLLGHTLIDKGCMARISDEEFQKAIEEAVNKSKVFAKIMTGSESEYILKVTIINLAFDSSGLNIEAYLIAQWELSDVSSKKVLWKDFIMTDYKATVGDTLNGIKRVEIANEGAARLNIQKGIHELSLLNLH